MLVKKSILLGLFAAAVFTFAAAGPTFAYINENIELDQETGFSLSPMRLQTDIMPGVVSEGKFRVRSTGRRDQNMFAEIVPFSVTGSNYDSPDYANFTQRSEIIRWITISLEGCDATAKEAGRVYFSMRPQEECYIQYKIDVPANAPAGSQHAALFVQDVVDDSMGGTGVIKSHRIGAVLYASNRKGDIEEQGKILKQDIPFWVFSGPLNTGALIENSGNIDFNAEIEIEVRNLFGQKVYTSEHPSKYIVLAETTRYITENWSHPGVGIFKTKQTVRMLGEAHAIEKWSFLVPMWLLIIVLIVVVVVFIARRYGRKNNKKGI